MKNRAGFRFGEPGDYKVLAGPPPSVAKPGHTVLSIWQPTGWLALDEGKRSEQMFGAQPRVELRIPSQAGRVPRVPVDSVLRSTEFSSSSRAS